jgi:hypothetical protein
MIHLTVLFQPLKVFLWIAAGLLLLSFVSVGIDVSHSKGKGGLADTTVILLLSTLITFMFGLLCDQVSAIRREMRR